MGFKKNNIKKISVNKKGKYFVNFIGLLSISLVMIIGYLIITNFDFIKLDILTIGKKDKAFVSSNIDIKKDNRSINILLVGRGGGNHDAPNLTDTMIVININFDSNIISMLSIPRDLYVDYKNGGAGRINNIYASNSHKSDSKDEGMKALGEKIEEITNQKIDYYINIDFNGFIKLIDSIGGVEMTIEKQFIDTTYPDGNWGYKTVVFKKGTWLFDGENALKFARSRHSTSDFDRSLRQQQIIDAVKNKLTAGFFLSSPFKIKELYGVFNKYVYTNISLQEMLTLGIKLKTSNYKLQSFNINDSCFYGSASCTTGGLLYIPSRDLFGGASVLLPENSNVNNLSNYKTIHKYTNLIFNNPDLYQENYRINILNSLKINYLASLLTDELNKYGFNLPEKNAIGNTQVPYEKSIIYYNNIDENSKTIQALKDFFPNITIEKTTGPKHAKELDVNIEIIIGKDYKTIFNPVY